MIKQQASVIAWRIWDIRSSLEQEGTPFIENPSHGMEIHPDLIRFKEYWYVSLNDFSRRGARIIRSRDGLNWEALPDPFPRGKRFSITANGELMLNTLRWDVTWHNGRGYSLAYTGKDIAGTLYATDDGKTWQVLAREVFPEAHRAGHEEASLAFEPSDGMVHAVVELRPTSTPKPMSPDDGA